MDGEERLKRICADCGTDIVGLANLRVRGNMCVQKEQEDFRMGEAYQRISNYNRLE